MSGRGRNDASCTADQCRVRFRCVLQNCAFLTLQKAYNNIAASLDLSGFTVTVQIGDGTYTGGLVVSQPWDRRWRGHVPGQQRDPCKCVLISTSSPSGLNAFGTNWLTSGYVDHQDLKATTHGGELHCALCGRTRSPRQHKLWRLFCGPCRSQRVRRQLECGW